ncbi:hypothetical protein BH20ACI4_BH20ACI4_25790 [soil metagenome]
MKKVLISFTIILSIASFVFAQDSNSNEKIENQNIVENDRPLKVLKIPKPKYPIPENGTICVTGSVRLRVQFLANGKIGDVKAISDLGYGLTENAVEAGRKIEFEPAIKNGKAITVVKVVVISFTIY